MQTIRKITVYDEENTKMETKVISSNKTASK